MSNKKDFNRICRKFLYCKSVFPASSNTGRVPYDKPPFVFIKVQSAHQIIRLLGVNVFSTLARHGLHKKRVSLTCLSRFKEPQIAQYGRVLRAMTISSLSITQAVSVISSPSCQLNWVRISLGITILPKVSILRVIPTSFVSSTAVSFSILFCMMIKTTSLELEPYLPAVSLQLVQP